MRLLLFILELSFRTGVLFLLPRRRRRRVSFYIFCFLQGTLSLPESVRLGGGSLSSLYVCTESMSFFYAKAVLYFFFSISLPFFRLTKLAIGGMNDLESRNPIQPPSAATLMTKTFAVCAPNVSPITSLRSRSNIPCPPMFKRLIWSRFARCETKSSECRPATLVDQWRQFFHNRLCYSVIHLSFVYVFIILYCFWCDDFWTLQARHRGLQRPLRQKSGHALHLTLLPGQISVRCHVRNSSPSRTTGIGRCIIRLRDLSSVEPRQAASV